MKISPYLNAFIATPLLAVSVTSCISLPKAKSEPSPGLSGKSINGFWAMIPLNNGTANVVEFSKDGSSTLYPFNCAKKTQGSPVKSRYAIVNDDKSIEVSHDKGKMIFDVLDQRGYYMKLGQKVENLQLEFGYIKVKKVASLCHLYSKGNIRERDPTPYKSSDFIAAPGVPDHPRIERYIGKWASPDGRVQIEVRREPDGQVVITKDSSENWHYLYNSVSWLGDELHYKSFAYSAKKRIFTHPYHKSSHKGILTPVADKNKIKRSFFISDKRRDYILTRQ